MAATTQQQTGREEIEQLKRDNAQLQAQLVQARAAAEDAGGGRASAAWLESQIRLHKTKAAQEEQLAQRIASELESIKQQLKQKTCSSAGVHGSRSTACGDSSGKQQVILQERLTHQKQRLDSLNARNTDKQRALHDAVKRTHATQVAAQQLHRQLCSTQEEAAAVLQLASLMEAARHKATQLCEVLLSHDDAEHLALSAVTKQVAALQLHTEQRQRDELHADELALSTVAREGCGLTEDRAWAVLQQLQDMLDDVGGNAGSWQGSQEAGAEGAEGVGGAPGEHAELVRRLMRLRTDSYRLFIQCSVADWCQQQRLLH